jgi:ElaB/YqjD/DUF883 family membrane-anchored ribosome-binding protein
MRCEPFCHARLPMPTAMTKSEKLDQLVSEVEAIFARLPDTLDPRIAALRDKVDDAIVETWTAVAGERQEAATSADGLLKHVNGCLRSHPWVVLSAALAIAALGKLFCRPVDRR